MILIRPWDDERAERDAFDPGSAPRRSPDGVEKLLDDEDETHGRDDQEDDPDAGHRRRLGDEVPQALLRAVRDASPDVVFFEEVNQRWLGALETLTSEYTTSVADPREDNFGIALFSRTTLEGSRIVYIGPAHVPSVLARIPFDGTVLSLLGTHAVPPVSYFGSRMRDQHLQATAEFLSELEGPRILLGDLNTTPWSRPFRRLLEQGSLVDGRLGWGLQPTWPAQFWPLLIPIDHCLHSADVRVLGLHVGPSVGSDHYPLIVEVGVR